jgi:hypothetical protein
VSTSRRSTRCASLASARHLLPKAPNLSKLLLAIRHLREESPYTLRCHRGARAAPSRRRDRAELAARIAAIRELLDRGYGRPRQSMEVSVPAGDPLQMLLDEIGTRSRIDPPVSHDPKRDHLPPGFNRAD